MKTRRPRAITTLFLCAAAGFSGGLASPSPAQDLVAQRTRRTGPPTVPPPNMFSNSQDREPRATPPDVAERAVELTPGSIARLTPRGRRELLDRITSNPPPRNELLRGVRLILGHGGDPFIRSATLSRGDTEEMDIFFDHGASPDDALEQTIRSVEATNETVNHLLKKGADPNFWSGAGMSPLQYALVDHIPNVSDSKAREELFKNVVNASYEERQGLLPDKDQSRTEFIPPEGRSSRIELVEMLLKAGANPNTPSERDIRRVFRKRGGDLSRTLEAHAETQRHLSPLMWALNIEGDARLAELLLDHGADPNRRTGADTQVYPPLVACAMHCCPLGLADKLIKAGARLGERSGRLFGTPLQMARRQNCNPHLIHFLEEHEYSLVTGDPPPRVTAYNRNIRGRDGRSRRRRRPPEDASTVTIVDGLINWFTNLGSPPAPEADASVADGERRAEPAARPADAVPGDSESGSAGSAR